MAVPNFFAYPVSMFKLDLAEMFITFEWLVWRDQFGNLYNYFGRDADRHERLFTGV